MAVCETPINKSFNKNLMEGFLEPLQVKINTKDNKNKFKNIKNIEDTYNKIINGLF